MYYMPMHWIDERLAEDRELENRKAHIQAEAIKIYNALWSYIEADINHANTTERFQVLRIMVNGSKSLHDVIVRKPATSLPKEFHFKLSSNMRTISVSGD